MRGLYCMDKNTNIISTINGKKVVLMNDAKFKSRRKINRGEPILMEDVEGLV